MSLCTSTGVDKTDASAAAVGLPPVDSTDLWPLLMGASSAPVRAMMQLSSNTMLDSEGWKIIVSK